MGRWMSFEACGVLAAGVLSVGGLLAGHARADTVTPAQPVTFTYEPAATDAPSADSSAAADLAGAGEVNPQSDLASAASTPAMLSLAPSNDEGVYTMPEPPTPDTGSNYGGVHLDLSLTYFNHYVYRGVDHSIGTPSVGITDLKASTLNLQIDGKIEFDLGRFPHPFVGIFADIYDADPVSRFQEFRPYVGVDWLVKPFTLEGGDTAYIYPDREFLNTAEFFGKITLNDGFLYHSDKPLLSPYFYGAYDYDKNKGWYMEAGITHDFEFEELGLKLTFQADAAYIIGFQQQFVFIDSLHDTGFQHFDTGMKADYSLNRLFNISSRFGEFDLLGYLFYTGKMDADLRANNVIWGGAGIGFKY
ncbi:MAG: hypothetical protein ABSH22_22140 [Tepidisphaeraceae bacterium]